MLEPSTGKWLTDVVLENCDAVRVGALAGPAPVSEILNGGLCAGVIASPLIVGTLGETLGWHYGFGAAGVRMLVEVDGTAVDHASPEEAFERMTFTFDVFDINQPVTIEAPPADQVTAIEDLESAFDFGSELPSP